MAQRAHIYPKFNYNYITDGIYIGSNQCCQIHFEEQLLKKGIRVDISLEEERLDAPFGVDIFIWIPVVNHTPPKQDQLVFGVSALKNLVAQKKKIYVHCKNGHGRAPTLVAAYLISKGMKIKEAIEFIKRRRPGIHLEKSQIKALERYFKKQKLLR